MSKDPWEWGVEDVVRELCHPEGQLRTQFANLTFNPEELAATLRNNGVDGETFLLALTKDTLKEDLEIPSLGLRFKIWRIIEIARAKSAKFEAFQTGNSDKFANSFNPAANAESRKRRPTSPPNEQLAVVRHEDLLPAQPITTNDGNVLPRDVPIDASVNAKAHRGEHIFVEESGRKRRKLTLAPKVGDYLDDHAMPVDFVFFGSTPVGGEVNLGIKGRDEEIQMEIDFAWSQVDDGSALIHYQCAAPARPGQSRYVGTLMRNFLLGNNVKKPHYYKHDETFAVGLQPSVQSTSNTKTSIPTPSLFVILNDAEGPTAYRVRAQDWQYDGSYTNEKHKASFPTRRKLLQTSNSLEDWSFLDKYVDGGDADEIVPLYGESGSEGSYDTETWEEMEAERLAKTNEKHSNHLPLDHVKAIIEEEKILMQAEWVSQKLPFLQNRAWKIWSRSRLGNTQSADVQSVQKEMTRLVTRLNKFEENICEMSWTKNSEVKAQCQSLQPTVVDKLAAEWKLNLLQQTNVPPKEQETMDRRTRIRAQLHDLGDDEEELTDSEYGDEFVVQDEHGDSNTVPNPQNQEAGSPGEEVQMNASLDEDLVLEDSMDMVQQPLDDLHEEIMGDAPDLQQSLAVIPDRPRPTGQEKPLPLFKMPREVHSMLPQEPSEVISLSSSEVDTTTSRGGSVTADEQNFWSMSLKQLRRVSWDEVNKAGDAKMKLAWLMTRQANLNAEILRLLDFDILKLIDLVCEGYKSLLARSYKHIRAMPPELDIDPQVVFRLGVWFIPWSKNVGWTEAADMSLDGIHQPVLVRMIKEWPPTVPDWQEFAAFVKDRILWGRKREYKKSLSVKERGKSTRAHFNSYKAQTPGQSQRDNARERQLAAQSRREQLQQLLAHSPLGETTLDAVVNLDKTSKDECVKVNEHIARRMKPHQLEGVQFMWTEIIASTANEGCLLAQPMGMGKTMQVIAFLLTVAETAKHTNPAIHEQIPKRLLPSHNMILAPPSLVENWYDELLKWLPSNSSKTIGEIYKLTNALSVPDRLAVVKEWDQQGGVLLLPTSFFRTAMLDETIEGRSSTYGEITDILSSRPGVVVVDEAQELKNIASKLSLAVRKLKTKARIAMTGSPLANNLAEYYNLIDFVAQGYLGTMQDFRARYITPITDGQYVDASKLDKRRALKMQKVLTQDLAPKIHRADVAQLHQQLHGKTEFVIRLRLTDLQLDCYRKYVESVCNREADTIQLARLWAFLSLLKLLCNHPKCFHDKLISRDAESNGIVSTPAQTENPDKSVPTFEETDQESQALAQDPTTILDDKMLRHQILLLRQPESLDAPSLSNKMVVLFEIVDLCVQSQEKLLIFSHSIPSMDYIEQHLRRLGVRMMRIDGSTKANLRQDQTKQFNVGEDQVALVSTRAGGVGLNLFGASRVVILDDWFNPILEQQAIGRAYRIGQTRHVYVYRLVAAGSYEEGLQNQANLKVGLANRIVDKKDTIRTASRSARSWLNAPAIVEPEDLSEARNRDGKVLERILQNGELVNHFQSIKLGDSFLVEEHEELTAEEQHEAAQLIKEEHLRRTNPEGYSQLMVAQQAALIRESRESINAAAGSYNDTLHPQLPTNNNGFVDTFTRQPPSEPPVPSIPNSELPVRTEPQAAQEAGMFHHSAGSHELARTHKPMGSHEPTGSHKHTGGHEIARAHEPARTLEPPVTPRRSTDREVIDLTLSETVPRVGDVQSDGSNEGHPRSESGKRPLLASDSFNVQPKQEPASAKKSRQLILPNSGKSQRVGTFGVDVAAMPKPDPLLVAPNESVLPSQAAVKQLNETSRSRARNKLGDRIFSRLDGHRTLAADEPKQRSLRRREAVIIEKTIFEKSKTQGEYYSHMEAHANNWVPSSTLLDGKPIQEHKKTTPNQHAKNVAIDKKQMHSSGHGKNHPAAYGKPKFAAQGKPYSSFAEAHLSKTSGKQQNIGSSNKQRASDQGNPHASNSGSQRSSLLNKHFADAGPRQSVEGSQSAQPQRQRSNVWRAPHLQIDSRSSADGQTPRSNASDQQARQWLDQHFSPTEQRSPLNSLAPLRQQQQPQPAASGRQAEFRDGQRRKLFLACRQAYEGVRHMIKMMPNDAIIAQLANQIEAEANARESDSAYTACLEPPPWRSLLVHLQENAPQCI